MTGNMFLNPLISVTLFLLFIIYTQSYSLRNPTKNILYLTDIHLDLLYDSNSVITGRFITRCKNNENLEIHSIKSFDYGRYSCNANENLLKETIEDVKKKFADIDLVIISGDQIAHGLYDLELKPSKEENKLIYRNTFTKIFTILKEAFPKAPIIPAIGNNDFYEHYVFPDNNSKEEQINFLKNLYFNNIDAANFNSDFNETVAEGFFYTQYDPNLGMKFIVLNTVLFSLKNKNKSSSNEIALKQMEFLERELDISAKQGKSVILIFHIPPFPNYVNNSVEFFFFDEYLHKFEKIIFDHKSTITNIFTGHLHNAKLGVRSKVVGKFIPQIDVLTKFDFLPKVFQMENYFSTVSFPSLTPVFANNPGYSIVKFNSEILKIEDIEVHYADLKQSLNEDMTFSKNIEISPENLFPYFYSFRKDFGFKNFDNQDFHNFIDHRIDDDLILSTYQMFVFGGKKNATEAERQFFLDILKKLGMLDVEDGCKMFKCSNKIFYQIEVDTC